MPKLFYLCSFLLIASIGRGQFTPGNQTGQGNRTGLMGDIKGNPIKYDNYADVTTGSPFLFEDYRMGTLNNGSGLAYPPLMLKVDLVADKVYYLNEAGQPMELASPVMYLKFNDKIAGKDVELLKAFYFTNYSKEGLKGWLQIHENGKAMLLEPKERNMRKSIPYGTAVADVRIDQKGGWVIAVDKEVLLVKKYKDAAEMLEKSNPAIKSFKPTQKALDAQLAELVRAFNQL